MPHRTEAYKAIKKPYSITIQGVDPELYEEYKKTVSERVGKKNLAEMNRQIFEHALHKFCEKKKSRT